MRVLASFSKLEVSQAQRKISTTAAAVAHIVMARAVFKVRA